jgi:hypothetical protein
MPDARAFKFTGTRFFPLRRKGAGFRFTVVPELPAKKTKNVRREFVL